jgi:hypothetical protein
MQSHAAHLEAAVPISVVTNHGRYAASEQGKPDTPVSLNKTATPSPHPTPPPLIIQQQEPQRDDSQPARHQTDSAANGAKQGDRENDHAPRVPPLKLPAVATKLMIGDSNLKNVSMKRLNAEREIQVRTISGARISTLQQVFDASEKTKSIKKVVLHVGTNNIAGRQSDSVQQCVKEYIALLDTVRAKMPDAKIAVSGIPPLKPWGKSKVAHQLNMELVDLCYTKRVTFLPHDALWEVDEDGLLNPRILRDKVHLSPEGLGYFLRDTKPFLTGARPRHSSAASAYHYNTNDGADDRSMSYASAAGGHGGSREGNNTASKRSSLQNADIQGKGATGRPDTSSRHEPDRRSDDYGETRGRGDSEQARGDAMTVTRSRTGAQPHYVDDSGSGGDRHFVGNSQNTMYRDATRTAPSPRNAHPSQVHDVDYRDFYMHGPSPQYPLYPSAMPFPPPPPPPTRDFYPPRGYYEYPHDFYRSW